LIDAIFHVLHEAGPAAISVWTWTIADYEVEAMAGLMACQGITAGRPVIDGSADRRKSLLSNTKIPTKIATPKTRPITS
jgi:hypothetical protein